MTDEFSCRTPAIGRSARILAFSGVLAASAAALADLASDAGMALAPRPAER